MPRQKREDYGGAWHHVMNRGARRKRIFFSDDECIKFLEIVEEAVLRYHLEVHAYSLMPNHYHLLAKSLEGNLSHCMRHIGANYTQWLNKRKGWDGPIFRGRYKSQLIEDEEYLRYLLAYIHLNPIEGKLALRLDSECWTSHRAYIGKDQVPEWLKVDTFLDLFSGADNLHGFVTSVRKKAISYPEDFNPDTGLFEKRAIVIKTKDFNQAPRYKSPRKKFFTAEEVLRQVCEICGVSMTEIMSTQKGPGANPARRFAIWSLVRGAGLFYRDVAKMLELPPYQVPKVMSRLQSNRVQPPLDKWIKEWEAKCQVS
jgi:REP element-mobilizing transposase RayT